MNVAGLEYEPHHRAYEIYLGGCKAPHCPHCHNPKLWSFDVGEDWREYRERIERDLQQSQRLVTSIWVLGGEPLDQDEKEFYEMIGWLRTLGRRLVLFTRYKEGPFFLFDAVKSGPYKEELPPYETKLFGKEITLSSNNQELINGNC